MFIIAQLCYTVSMNFVKPLLDWYEQNHRNLPWRNTRDPYKIWVSEIMLQQTRVAAVIPYYERFLKELPTVIDLARCDEDRLLKLWQGLGYYSRARNLKKAAETVVQNHRGELPRTYAELKTLSGIGSYTAAAVASIAYNERVPAVDGNVLRVFARLYDSACDVTEEKTKRQVFETLRVQMPENAGTFNQAMMELGATVCVPNGEPHCDRCPILGLCRAKQNGTVALRPVKKSKPERKEELLTVFVLQSGDRFLLRKRKGSGLLADLYELPNTSGHLVRRPDGRPDLSDALLEIGRIGATPCGEITVYERRHIFTHRTWQMQVVACAVAESEIEGWLWYDGTQSLPTAFRICLGDDSMSS